MKKILIAVDGSESSEKALMKAKKIGSVLNSEITILHVIKYLSNPDTFYTAYVTEHDVNVQKKLKEESKKLLDSYKEIFAGYSGKVKTLTKNGKPGDIITSLADEGDYDLIIMGNRGLGAFTGAMLGSVSNKVANRSKESVLIVK